MSRRMSFKDACDFVPDDLPDGAYWAMAHEIAGLEYGEGFAELRTGRPVQARPEKPVYRMGKKQRKQVEAFGELRNNDAYHWQVRDGKRVIADWWPHKCKWRVGGKLGFGGTAEFLKALAAASPTPNQDQMRKGEEDE